MPNLLNADCSRLIWFFKKLGIQRVEWLVFGGAPSVPPDVPCKFVGKVFGEALAELYNSAHIVFMNSWHESFPLPPLEAMACGTAVVTTRLGTEDYAFDGKNAIVIPPRSPSLFAEGIIHLAEDPAFARQLAEAGVETASNFTWDRATDQLEEILSSCLEQPSNRLFVDIEDMIAGKLYMEHEASSSEEGKE